ncbi:MAG: glycosyltransferase family 4 protein [Rhodospirillales bacterium]
MDWTPYAVVVVLAFAASFAGTGLILRLLRSRAILDHPNERSSHSRPTPKGAGIVVVAVILATWLGLGWGTPVAGTTRVVVAAAFGLALLSWLDDLKGLNPLVRLLGHVAAVASVLALAPPASPFFGGILPRPLDMAAAALLWVWFINLFNFMDGIDGIAGTETVAIGLGVALVAAATPLSPAFAVYGLVVAVGALGFLWWNWHPARTFLGDVGSVPLGFLLGWLLLGLAKNGQWAPALILPLYYLADATITLARRVLRGETVWHAHREHFYQLAVRRGLGHADVVYRVLLADAALVVLAVAAARGWVWAALLGAVAVVSWLLAVLGGGRRAAT